MSNKANREQRILDRLYQENRDLKKEVKSLRNSIRKLNKGYVKLEEEEKITEKDIPVEAKLCYDCNRANLEKIVVLNRYWRECPNCGKRTKTKIIC